MSRREANEGNAERGSQEVGTHYEINMNKSR